MKIYLSVIQILLALFVLFLFVTEGINIFETLVLAFLGLIYSAVCKEEGEKKLMKKTTIKPPSFDCLDKPSITKKSNRPIAPKKRKQKHEGLLLVKVGGVGKINDEKISKIRKRIIEQLVDGVIVYPKQLIEIEHVCNCSDVEIKKGV